MSTKHVKNGLDLFIVTPEMLTGLETLALQFKEINDNKNYDFLMTIKTALSKYAVIAQHVTEMAALERAVACALKKAADFSEQLFPVSRKMKGQDISEKEAK